MIINKGGSLRDLQFGDHIPFVVLIWTKKVNSKIHSLRRCFSMYVKTSMWTMSQAFRYKIIQTSFNLVIKSIIPVNQLFAIPSDQGTDNGNSNVIRTIDRGGLYRGPKLTRRIRSLIFYDDAFILARRKCVVENVSICMKLCKLVEHTAQHIPTQVVGFYH